MYTEKTSYPHQAHVTSADDLPVEHLQLRNVVNAALRQRGIVSVGDAIAYTGRSVFFQFPYSPDVWESVKELQQCRTGSTVDWQRYWELRGQRFHHLCAVLPSLDHLTPVDLAYPVDRRTLGNAGAMLQAAGIKNLGMLRSGLIGGLGNVRGLGKSKLADLFRSLIRLADEITAKGDLAAFRPDSETDAAATPKLSWAELPDVARSLPLSILHVGQKSVWLRRAGYTTVGKLVEADPRQLNMLTAVGPATVRTLLDRVQLLAASCVGDSLDLTSYCGRCGLDLLPKNDVTSGDQLLAILPHLIESVSERLQDEVDRQILKERLLLPPHARRRLEDIARQCQPPITRERVRQKQRNLLNQLSASLIWNKDNTLGIQFHPSFSAWWALAAKEFAGKEDIGFDEFVSSLGRVWQVNPEALTPHLPIILALVTCEPQMPIAFRAGIRLNSNLLMELQPSTAQISIRHLRLGKYFERLQSRGITTLRQIIDAAKSGALPADVNAHLTVVGNSLTAEGGMDWDRYAASLELDSAPAKLPRNAESFAADFCETIAEIVRRTGTDRRVRIFEMRTSQPSQTRLTLDAIAKMLGTHGPTVKREETLMLQELHEILIDKEFATLDYWLDASWLKYVGEAKEAFQASDRQYDRFEAALALRWGIGTRALHASLPALWAILTGYPERRLSRAGRITASDVEIAPVVAERIKLRGFRRLH